MLSAYQRVLIQLDELAASAGTRAPAWQLSPEIDALATLLRLLGDPRRLILVHLLASSERCVCEFEDLLGWPQNLISHHLGVLRRAGLVTARRDAQWVYYSLVPETFDRTRQLLGEVLGPGELPPEARYGAAPRRCSP